MNEVLKKEKKYLLSYDQFRRLDHTFEQVLRPDSHNGTYGYPIRSLYFDTMQERDFYEKEEKEPEILTEYEGYHAKQVMKMTHMEAFFYPVWENCPEKICERWEKPGFLLFDYEKRNPLTGDARTVLI